MLAYSEYRIYIPLDYTYKLFKITSNNNGFPRMSNEKKEKVGCCYKELTVS